MTERLLIALALIAFGVLAWRVYNRLALRPRAARDPLLTAVPHGTPTVLYFTTPFCAPCHYQQRPALAQLHQWMPDVRVVEVDATQDPDAATRWGVLSAPTTFVLDGHGQPRHVNRGVASAAQLRAQLGAL